MRVENVHFCPITAFLPFLFLPSEGVKPALEATFSALLITSLNNVIKLGGFEKFYYLCLQYRANDIAPYELKTLKVR